MRISRVEKFKKTRRKKIRKFVFYTIIIPITCVATGYLITTIVILPAMSK
jgi:hypothetical protein